MGKPQIFEIHQAHIREENNASRDREEGKRALEGCLQDTVKGEAVLGIKDMDDNARAVLRKAVRV